MHSTKKFKFARYYIVTLPHSLPSATHTITLHVDMTSLDLSGTKACCKRHDLQKFRRLGFNVDEVVEVAVKLNALRSMGVHLSIEGEREREGGGREREREGGGWKERGSGGGTQCILL